MRIPEIDEQHRALFDHVNYLYDSMRDGRSNEALRQVLQDLVDYSQYHFRSEEVIMERYRYPEMAKHVKEHEYFIVRVQTYVENYNKGNMVLSLDVVNFIKKWIQNHVEKSDQGYSKHIMTNKDDIVS